MFRKMYLALFNAVTDAIRALDRGEAVRARQILVSAQQESEEIYLQGEED